jgi:hypothetical protein
VSDTLRRALPILVIVAVLAGIWLGVVAFDAIS